MIFFYRKKDGTFLLGKGETHELHMQLLEGDSKNRGDGVTYPVWSTGCSTLVFSEVRVFLEKKKSLYPTCHNGMQFVLVHTIVMVSVLDYV